VNLRYTVTLIHKTSVKYIECIHETILKFSVEKQMKSYVGDLEPFVIAQSIIPMCT